MKLSFFNKRAIIFYIILIIGYVVYLNFNSSQINPIEKYYLKEFREEWNKNLPELKKKIENNEFTELAPNSKWERIMIPYGELLPEYPNEKNNNSTLLGIDSNGNGVRDDLEILTVKEFGGDRDVVEVVFAEIRSYDYDIYIYENNLMNKENLQNVIDHTSLQVRCFNFLSSLYYSDTEIFKKNLNTKNRQKVYENVSRSLLGVSKYKNISQKDCRDWIKETKSWDFRNK